MLAGALIAPPVRAGPARAEAPTATAERLYLEGRRQWDLRTREGLTEALRLFHRAAAAAPRYERAHAGLADAYNMLGDYRFLAPRDAYPKAKRAARRALDLDPGLAEAHAALGWATCIFDWRLEEAVRSFRRALELDPRYGVAYHFYAFCLGSAGRTDEAEGLIARARELEPDSSIIRTDVAVLRLFQKRYAEAVPLLEDILRARPDFVTARFTLGMAYEALGRRPEAVAELERAAALAQRSTLTVALLAWAEAAAGRTERARALHAELVRRSAAEYVSALDLAAIETALGQREAALTLLERACDERAPWMLQLDGDRRFEVLRSDPRFLALVGRCGLPRHPR